ncbi:MAG: SagB/ThcOx family dehydrogenase [Candidatus Cloacimonetes bacterium]|nr:SagB/ThcOx family dehydrogenase [Candidatus Cloacimonadota bacterium]
MIKVDKLREFMKSNFNLVKDIETDQMKGLPQPSLEKEYDTDKELIDLKPGDEINIQNADLISNIKNRKSHRKFNNDPVTKDELSFLLWATQGVKKIFERNKKAYATFRTVPSAGARHPLETYLLINNISGLKKGLYRYLALEHKLLFLNKIQDAATKITSATQGQKFIGEAAVVFIWSCIAYRGEWRYNIASHKAMLLDAGHLCQNLYLACEGIAAGTCAIAAYDQDKVDKLIGVDGQNEYSVYLAPVGKY